MCSLQQRLSASTLSNQVTGLMVGFCVGVLHPLRSSQCEVAVDRFDMEDAWGFGAWPVTTLQVLLTPQPAYHVCNMLLCPTVTYDNTCYISAALLYAYVAALWSGQRLSGWLAVLICRWGFARWLGFRVGVRNPAVGLGFSSKVLSPSVGFGISSRH